MSSPDSPPLPSGSPPMRDDVSAEPLVEVAHSFTTDITCINGVGNNLLVACQDGTIHKFTVKSGKLNSKDHKQINDISRRGTDDTFDYQIRQYRHIDLVGKYLCAADDQTIEIYNTNLVGVQAPIFWVDIPDVYDLCHNEREDTALYMLQYGKRLMKLEIEKSGDDDIQNLHDLPNPTLCSHSINETLYAGTTHSTVKIVRDLKDGFKLGKQIVLEKDTQIPVDGVSVTKDKYLFASSERFNKLFLYNLNNDRMRKTQIPLNYSRPRYPVAFGRRQFAFVSGDDEVRYYYKPLLSLKVRKPWEHKTWQFKDAVIGMVQFEKSAVVASHTELHVIKFK